MSIVKTPAFFTLSTLVCLLALNSSVAAQSLALPEDSNWQLSLAVGAGVRTNPVMDNDNIPLIVIPQVSYQGERFFIQNLDFGYSVLEDDNQQINLLLTPSYDQVFFNESGVNNFIDTSEFANATKSAPTVELVSDAIDKGRLHKRRMAALAGIEYSQTVQGFDVQLQALREITRYYHGNEVRVAFSKGINLGKNDVKLTLGANWQDAATLNYFYGITETEASNNLSYRPDSGVTTLLRFDWSYEVDEHWSLRFFTSYRHLGRSISNSPLVTSDNVVTAFAGGVYHF
ncbi:MAG: MipA/OmpV family protein [Gammaproteobacteria bacterium]|nr:MAG: MipA/OmpV family protein [Gammaproteobacteria bacterium]